MKTALLPHLFSVLMLAACAPAVAAASEHREFDATLYAPFQSGAQAQRSFTLQRLSERPEVQRQEQREQQPREAVDEKRPVRGMVARAEVVPHANTAHTARRPHAARSNPVNRTHMSS